MQAVPEVQLTTTGCPVCWIKPKAKKAALRSSVTLYNSKSESCSSKWIKGKCLLPGLKTTRVIPNCFKREWIWTTVFNAFSHNYLDIFDFTKLINFFLVILSIPINHTAVIVLKTQTKTIIALANKELSKRLGSHR